MNSLKTVIVVAVMAVVAYGVYATLTKGPADTAASGNRGSSDSAGHAANPPPAFAPKFVPSQPAGAAPRPVQQAQAHDHRVNTAEGIDASHSITIEPGAPTATLPEHLAQSAHSGDQPRKGSAIDRSADTGATGFALAEDADLDASPVRSASVGPEDVDPATTASAKPDPEFAAAKSAIQAHLDEGRLADALRELTLWYDDRRLSSIEQADVLVLLDQLAGSVVYSRQHLLIGPHQVQPGETLETVAAKYHVSSQLLAKINGIPDPRSVKAGDTLKVLPGPFAAVIDLEKFRLTLFVDGCYAGRFLIGTGSVPSTPLGEFAVREKLEDPEYTAADGRKISADDPNNPLGEFWIGLGNRVGIHGTHDPAQIGRRGGQGSIALGADDIGHIFDILSVGSTVVIRQ